MGTSDRKQEAEAERARQLQLVEKLMEQGVSFADPARVDIRGRIAAFEFLVVSNAISNLIRENKVFRIPSSIQTGKKLGMQLLDDHIFQLFTEGKVSEEDAIDHCRSTVDLQEKIKVFHGGKASG